MKARELAVWLLERPDLEVLVADPGDGWDPVYTEPEPEETQGVAYFNVTNPVVVIQSGRVVAGGS